MTTLTPMQAIRAKCIDCSGGSRTEVKYCPVTDCPLFPLRLGKRPNGGQRKAMSPEHKARLIAAGAAARARRAAASK